MLIPPGDTGAIVSAMSSLLDDPNKRKQLGKMGAERVRRLFNWEKTARQTADYYREAVESQAAHALV